MSNPAPKRFLLLARVLREPLLDTVHVRLRVEFHAPRTVPERCLGDRRLAALVVAEGLRAHVQRCSDLGGGEEGLGCSGHCVGPFKGKVRAVPELLITSYTAYGPERKLGA